MEFLNEVQTALLFDKRISSLEQIVKIFLKTEADRGATFNVPEAKPGTFYRLYGATQRLMITLEYLDQPANTAVFQQALGSAFTSMACPDMRQRLAGHRSHILINVSHGVFGGVAKDPKIAAMFAAIGLKEGQSLPEFKTRLEVLTTLTRIAHHVASATIVHWTPCNNLLSGDAFKTLAGAGLPGPLYIHPFLFGTQKGAAGKPEIGIRTFGVRHFIGREILVEPTTLPWSANFEIILTLLRVALVEHGYIIPDGDVFGPEDGSQSYRVIHRTAQPGDVPLIEIIPLIHQEYGYQAPGYVKPPRIISDQLPPAELVPADAAARQILTDAWRRKRAMAEGIGGQFQVRAPAGETDAPAPPPSAGMLPRVFGRKRPA